MTSSSFVHQGRRWAIAAAFVVTVGQKASAQVTRATAIRDTMATYTGRWRDELPTMLVRVATVLDSGFAAPERELVLREMRAIRMRVRPGSDGHYPDKTYLLQVQFRRRRTTLSMFAYWPDTVRVAFRVYSPDTLLIAAIDSSFRAARVPLLSPPGRVRVAVGNSYVSEGAFRQINVELATDVATHCPRFGLETHGDARGDTLIIHIDGAAPRDRCLDVEWPPRMSYWLPVTPRLYHLEIDNKADTNLFTVRVTDTSVALSTIRSSFVTADERVRRRVPKGSFVLSCGAYVERYRAACDELQSWAATRAGLQRIAFDTTEVSPLSDGALAYRYADDRVLANTRSCIHSIKPALKRDARVELWIRPRSGPWVVDRGATMNAESKVPSDSTCGLPPSIVESPRTFAFTAYPLNCPTPTAYVRRVVASVLSKSEGTPEWFREHNVAVPTANALQPLSGPSNMTRCGLIDSTSSRRPVYVFRAGRYFIATTVDAAGTDIVLDDSPPLYLVWVLDSASTVVHVPGYSSLAQFSISGAHRQGGVQPRRDTVPVPMRFTPQDVHVTSTRAGDVVLQWTRPPRPPADQVFALERAAGAGAFTSIGATMHFTTVATMDTTALPGTSYRYRLRARLTSGDTAYSNEVRLTTPRVPVPRLAWPRGLYLRPAVRGRVLDSLTGRPVANLFLRVKDRSLFSRTDSLGRYIFGDVPPGTHTVTFSCPAKRGWGERTIATRRLDVTPRTDSVVDFNIRLRNCEEPPLRTWSGEFRGHYVTGFETSMFAPCVPFESFIGTAYEGVDRADAWVSFSEAAGAQGRSMWPPDTKPAQEYPPMYVRWRATVEGPASYGHMGVSLYNMRVTEVMELRRSAPTDCRE